MISILISTNTPEKLPDLAKIVPSHADLRTTVRAPVPGSSDLAGFDYVFIVSDGSGSEGIDLLRLTEGRDDTPGLIIVAKSCDAEIAAEALIKGAEYYILPWSPGEFAATFFLVVKRSVDARRVKQTLDFLQKKLSLVGSVTRHDVLNQMTAIGGYNELLSMMVEDPKMKGFIEKEFSALERIRIQFQYAKDYQNIGIDPPRWQEIRTIAGRMNDVLDLGKIRVTVTTGTALIYADPLLEKTFFYLFDNALCHGVKVTELRVSLREESSGAVLIIEDDGIGVLDEDKAKIFERGYGKNTGWGLFLVREILAFTDMTIVETGEPGIGARFEIKIPEGYYQAGPL